MFHLGWTQQETLKQLSVVVVDPFIPICWVIERGGESVIE